MEVNAEHFQKDVLREFRKMKGQGEAAIGQLAEADFFKSLDENGNSIAVILKHMAGNMHSRWPDFLQSDGESRDRQREREFVIEAGDTRGSLLESWRRGWEELFTAISSLQPDDFGTTVLIRKEPHSVVQAIMRELIHYAGHTGQMIFLAKHLAGGQWKTLSVPRGGSDEFNAEVKPYLQEFQE